MSREQDGTGMLKAVNAWQAQEIEQKDQQLAALREALEKIVSMQPTMATNVGEVVEVARNALSTTDTGHQVRED